MASELCMNCFSVKGQYEVCPFCGYAEGTPPEQPHYLTSGTVIGNHFIVGTVIGIGGFGITYKCFDITLGVVVAVKEFYPVGLVNRAPGESRVGLLSGEKQNQYKVQLNRFLMEAQSVAQFSKAKDIVNIYDYFEENGTAYIIMEYIDGVLLKDYLERQGPMHPNVAMSITMLIIDAVKKIHSKGIIHRDISPDNIFITDENSVKIFDFGAAQLNDTQEGMEGEKVIKVGYSAPEQYREKSRQGFYTDVYSVGAILYQMLTGTKPIESTEREYKDELKSPLELGIKVNSNVDRAVMEALAVKPELRFQGIQQFEDALRNKRVAEYPKEKLKRRRRKRNWIIGTAVTLVLAVGVAIGLYSTLLKPVSVIFDSEIQGDISVAIWVENEDQKELLEAVTEKGFRQGDMSAMEQQNPEQWQKFWSENERVEVNVTVHEDMQRDLESASDAEKPNMYLTDHVSDEAKQDLISLEDIIYTDLNIEDYAYMSEYERYFPDYKEMPTGLDTLLVYTCSVNYHKDNGLEDDSVTHDMISEAEKTDQAAASPEDGDKILTVELRDLIDGDETKYVIRNEQGTEVLSSALATFDQAAIADALTLSDSREWNAFFALNANFIPDTGTLEKILSFQSVAEKPEYMLSSKADDPKDTTQIYGKKIVAGAAYRSDMEDALAKSANDITRRNPLSGYTTHVVTSNQKMLVKYAERYGITRSSTNEQRVACKRLLFVMMQPTGQEKKKESRNKMTFPIRIQQLRSFAEIKNDMGDFADLFAEEYPCELIGGLTGNMYQFTKGLDVIETDRKVLQSYCDEYIGSFQNEKN